MRDCAIFRDNETKKIIHRIFLAFRNIFVKKTSRENTRFLLLIYFSKSQLMHGLDFEKNKHDKEDTFLRKSIFSVFEFYISKIYI